MAYLGNAPQFSTMRTLAEGQAYSGQTEIPVPGGLTSGMVDVVIGGATLSAGDYDDSNGMSIKLNQAMLVGTQYRVVAWTPNQTVVNASGQLAGFRNRIINGSMDIAQRGTSGTILSTSGYQSVDRWGTRGTTGSGHTFAQVTDAPTGFISSAKVTVGTGGTPAAGDLNYIYQAIEGYNVMDFAFGTSSAQTIVVSFWVKASISGTYAFNIINMANNRSYVTNYTVANPNVWQYQSIVIPGDITGTWLTNNNTGLYVLWDLGSGSTYNTSTINSWQAGWYQNQSTSVRPISTSGATFQITGVQLEKGSVATQFERRSYGLELALCQRYFFGFLNGGVLTVSGPINSILAQMKSPVTMRIAPTASTNVASGNYTAGAPGANQWAFVAAGAVYPSVSSGTITIDPTQATTTNIVSILAYGMNLSSVPNMMVLGSNMYATYSAEL